MKSELIFGSLKIFLPDENTGNFYIFQDIAELFGDEFQSDAVRKLKKEIKSITLKPSPSIDYEGSNASIRTTNPETLLQTIRIINNLSILKYRHSFSEGDWDNFKHQLFCWKRPKPQKWNVGDVFSIKLMDESYSFGQVVGKHPTIVLFDIKKDSESVEHCELESAKVVTLLHLLDDRLRDKTWKILSNYKILVDKDSGKFSNDRFRVSQTSFSSRALEQAANYYWFKVFTWANEDDVKDLIMLKK